MLPLSSDLVLKSTQCGRRGWFARQPVDSLKRITSGAIPDLLTSNHISHLVAKAITSKDPVVLQYPRSAGKSRVDFMRYGPFLNQWLIDAMHSNRDEFFVNPVLHAPFPEISASLPLVRCAADSTPSEPAVDVYLPTISLRPRLRQYRALNMAAWPLAGVALRSVTSVFVNHHFRLSELASQSSPAASSLLSDAALASVAAAQPSLATARAAADARIRRLTSLDTDSHPHLHLMWRTPEALRLLASHISAGIPPIRADSDDDSAAQVAGWNDKAERSASIVPSAAIFRMMDITESAATAAYAALHTAIAAHLVTSAPAPPPAVPLRACRSCEYMGTTLCHAPEGGRVPVWDIPYVPSVITRSLLVRRSAASRAAAPPSSPHETPYVSTWSLAAGDVPLPGDDPHADVCDGHVEEGVGGAAGAQGERVITPAQAATVRRIRASEGTRRDTAVADGAAVDGAAPASGGALIAHNSETAGNSAPYVEIVGTGALRAWMGVHRSHLSSSPASTAVGGEAATGAAECDTSAAGRCPSQASQSVSTPAPVAPTLPIAATRPTKLPAPPTNHRVYDGAVCAYFLDFETIMSPIPLAPHHPPYTPLVIQWSLHRTSRGGGAPPHAVADQSSATASGASAAATAGESLVRWTRDEEATRSRCEVGWAAVAEAALRGDRTSGPPPKEVVDTSGAPIGWAAIAAAERDVRVDWAAHLVGLTADDVAAAVAAPRWTAGRVARAPAAAAAAAVCSLPTPTPHTRRASAQLNPIAPHGSMGGTVTAAGDDPVTVAAEEAFTVLASAGGGALSAPLCRTHTDASRDALAGGVVAHCAARAHVQRSATDANEQLRAPTLASASLEEVAAAAAAAGVQACTPTLSRGDMRYALHHASSLAAASARGEFLRLEERALQSLIVACGGSLDCLGAREGDAPSTALPPIYVYSPFESSTLVKAAARHPKLAPHLLALRARLVDLQKAVAAIASPPLPLTSLKRVFPAVAPQCAAAYASDDIANGFLAAAMLLEIVIVAAHPTESSASSGRDIGAGKLRDFAADVTTTADSAVSNLGATGVVAADEADDPVVARMDVIMRAAGLPRTATLPQGPAGQGGHAGDLAPLARADALTRARGALVRYCRTDTRALVALEAAIRRAHITLDRDCDSEVRKYIPR